jgi:hypothetical protein
MHWCPLSFISFEAGIGIRRTSRLFLFLAVNEDFVDAEAVKSERSRGMENECGPCTTEVIIKREAGHIIVTGKKG